MNREIQITATVVFSDRGVIRQGRVVGIEQVERGNLLGRSPGRWFTIRITGTLFEDIEVPETAFGSSLDAEA